jgi:transposase-like protein
MERAEDYLAAAREHFRALAGLPEEPPHYPLAYYLAGLAVVCLFRAYTELVDAEHDAKHDLRRHMESARFLEFMPAEDREAILANVTDVRTRWLNKHRYSSKASLRRYLNESELYRLAGNRTIKGGQDRILQHNWDVLLNAALDLLTLGIERWETSKIKWNRL